MPISLYLRRSERDDDELLALLDGCHERIRRFSRLALTVAEADAAPAARAAAAAEVVRYFTIALPLHARDEDDSLAPRLRGRDAALDAALDRMTADHVAHAILLDPVVAACAALAADPTGHAARATALAADARALIAAFDDHLALEESIVFPALAALPAALRATLRAELAARRA